MEMPPPATVATLAVMVLADMETALLLGFGPGSADWVRFESARPPPTLGEELPLITTDERFRLPLPSVPASQASPPPPSRAVAPLPPLRVTPEMLTGMPGPWLEGSGLIGERSRIEKIWSPLVA